MLIVKNLFSFYVEFEILLYFLLFCRSLSVNKDVKMRNNAWNKMGRIYTKKSIADRNCQNLLILNCGPQMLSGSFWKKMQKCRTVIFGLTARICSFKAVFSLELIDFGTPSSQTSLNCLERRSKARKKRKNTIRGRI
jgi:hypothetical protein